MHGAPHPTHVNDEDRNSVHQDRSSSRSAPKPGVSSAAPQPSFLQEASESTYARHSRPGFHCDPDQGVCGEVWCCTAAGASATIRLAKQIEQASKKCVELQSYDFNPRVVLSLCLPAGAAVGQARHAFLFYVTIAQVHVFQLGAAPDY